MKSCKENLKPISSTPSSCQNQKSASSKIGSSNLKLNRIVTSFGTELNLLKNKSLLNSNNKKQEVKIKLKEVKSKISKMNAENSYNLSRRPKHIGSDSLKTIGNYNRFLKTHMYILNSFKDIHNFIEKKQIKIFNKKSCSTLSEQNKLSNKCEKGKKEPTITKVKVFASTKSNFDITQSSNFRICKS